MRTSVSKYKYPHTHTADGHITREWLHYYALYARRYRGIIIIICDNVIYYCDVRKPGLRDFYYEIRARQCDNFKRIYNASLFGHWAIVITIFHKCPHRLDVVGGVHRS